MPDEPERSAVVPCVRAQGRRRSRSVRMNGNPAWRGQRRVRVSLEIGPPTVRVAGMWLLDGPAVQRRTLDGTHIAHVTLAGATAILQSFDDPRLIRGASRPDRAGHKYEHAHRALLRID